MSFSRRISFCFLLSFAACESPHDKISRLQSELLTVLGEQDFYEIRTKKQTIRLPLPPSPELADARKQLVLDINLETYSFENENLSEPDQKRLNLLCTNLKEMVKRGNAAFFDPAKCVLTDELLKNLQSGDQSVLEVLCQKIPEYYAEVERRWQAPDPGRANVAATKSLLVLDDLEKIGDKASPARLAVKDFICLCHSAVLKD